MYLSSTGPAQASTTVSEVTRLCRSSEAAHFLFPWQPISWTTETDASTAAYPMEKRTDSFSFLNARCDLFSVDSFLSRLQLFLGLSI